MSEARFLEDLLRGKPGEPAKVAEIQRALDACDRVAFASQCKVHVLRNFTLENALPSLRFSGYRSAVRIDATLSGFDAYRQDALARPSDLADADMVMVWLWLEAMPMAWDANGLLDIAAAESELFGLLDDLTASSSSPIAVHTFVAPLGAGSNWEGHDRLDALNRSVRDRVKAHPRLVLIDVARMVDALGRSSALDARFALMHRAPIATGLAHAWGDAVAQTIAARKGKIRKVLVIDADETLWGGIIGEDGREGIRLSEHAYPGNAYHAFQRQLLALRRRGVLLALSSKNDPESVLEVLDSHPASLLKREHFSSIKIGWGPKSQAIREMAQELGLGLDAFVFADDSSVECAEVQSALPMVEVLQVPREAHRVPSLLENVRFFDTPSTTREDTQRADHYAQETARNEQRARYADLDSFLASLDLEATVGAPCTQEIERVAQLTQRTNQFNLTTRRYDVGQITHMMESDRFVVLAMRVRDRYGDYGLTGLAIANVDELGNARIDSLLMSCRTLGRRLEDALLAELVQAIRGVTPTGDIAADFIPTAKNSQVARFFDERGFDRIDTEQADGAPRAYRLANQAVPAVPPFIRIRRSS